MAIGPSTMLCVWEDVIDEDSVEKDAYEMFEGQQGLLTEVRVPEHRDHSAEYMRKSLQIQPGIISSGPFSDTLVQTGSQQGFSLWYFEVQMSMSRFNPTESSSRQVRMSAAGLGIRPLNRFAAVI